MSQNIRFYTITTDNARAGANGNVKVPKGQKVAGLVGQYGILYCTVIIDGVKLNGSTDSWNYK